MFWRFGGYANISSLDTILDKPDVTVEELLDESDLIQELKQNNSKLIEFLRDEAVLQKLLRYVVADKPLEPTEGDDKPDDAKTEEEKSVGISFFGKGKAPARSKSRAAKDGDGETELEKQEAQRKKYAYVACEVLSAEVWSITEALLDMQASLKEFWEYMRRPAPLDALQAGYFTKVNEVLLDKKTEEMLTFIKSLDGIVESMLQHVDCPMVMDLLLKIISLEKHEGGAGIVDWLQTQNLIPLLLGYLSPEHSSATQTSAGDFLKAIITISANATAQDQSVIGPNELTRQLVSDRCIKILIENMLRGGNPLTVGVGIIIEVIRKNNSDYDAENHMSPQPKTSDPIYLGSLLRQFANNVPHFMHLVRSKDAKKPDLKAAFGGKIEPLGFDRFKTCELMAELLHCSNMGLLNERGAENEVRRRDEERERMKADGKLATPRAPTSPSHEEFGSSVDSHGFHHAERPSDDDMESSGEIGRKLEVQNASDEDGFEKVNAPLDDPLDDVTFDDFNEKLDQTGLPTLDNLEKRDPTLSPIPHDADVPKPLSPSKTKTQASAESHFDVLPPAGDSPTSAGVTDKLGNMGVDGDTVMSEGTVESKNELETDIAGHPEDKPAPLFARKAATDATESIKSESEDQTEVEQSVATIQGEEIQPNGERADYETEADGSPVVGDLLKIQFVEHQVVPTILDFFFRFPWNNFLHNVVYDVVQQVFNGTLDRGYNRTLSFDLFKPSKIDESKSLESLGLLSTKDIIDRILDGQEASDKSQTEKGMRLGYMGHLTLIAEEVCKFGSRNPSEQLDKIVLDSVNRDEWIKYVEGTLTETREKDHAVLGGVRPENAAHVRSMGMGLGSFSSNTANTLANAGIGAGISAQDSLAMSEGTVGESFNLHSGSMLSGFGDGDDDEDMEEEMISGLRRSGGLTAADAFSEEEQISADAHNDAESGDSSLPQALNVAPSRARLQLAARLAQRKKEAQASAHGDPDVDDVTAVATAHSLPDNPPDIDMAPSAEGGQGLKITGIRTLSDASRFSGMFSSGSSSSSSDDFDEDEAGRDITVGRLGGDYEDDTSGSAGFVYSKRSKEQRRPSTTEAKERRPLDDDDDDDEVEEKDEHGNTLGTAMDRRLFMGHGPYTEMAVEEATTTSSDEEDPVEIAPRRRVS
ncbi:Hypothetical protein R9X50_00052400 [Acrodontium crateriforme]|uniref:Uncharacterized protein n=1 Tax=Acrodontium crateriforme TaxID=150365 RepID=A0AAQ3LXM7_9PEZI|nr:Hypothetical protein R9X50_00052400 [Acrodontium crateriforme]